MGEPSERRDRAVGLMTKPVLRPRNAFETVLGQNRGMRRRLAWVVLASVGLSALGRQVLSARTGSGVDPTALAFLLFPTVGALILSRQPRNAIGVILLGIGVGIGFSDALGIYAYYGLTVRPGVLPGPEFALALESPMWVPFIGLPGTFLLLLFPDGRLPSPRWKPWAYFCGIAMVLCYTALLILPVSFADAGYPGVSNPLGIDALKPVEEAVVSVVALIPVAIVGCAVALIRRFRRSHGLARVQLKWLAAAAGVVAFSYLMLMALHFAFGDPDPAWLGIVSLLGILSFALIPIAIGFAILRHRLYDIDRIINRTLVYGVLTAVLAAIYAGLVVGLPGLLDDTFRQSQLLVAGTTLLVAALFQPLRGRIQRFIDRRFYRGRYDAGRTVEAFSARLRAEVQLDAVATDLLGVVRDTLQPKDASVWLMPDTDH